MESEAEFRAVFDAQRHVQRQQRAAMEEVQSELRQQVLASGVDERLLREYELNAIDLALQAALERTMDERGRGRNLSA